MPIGPTFLVGNICAQERVSQMLELVRLEPYKDRSVTVLSGGQKQRVALARALVFQPPVLLMDEPLGALDRNLREHMQAEIKNIQRSLNVTAIYVTHDQGEALSMSDTIAIMNDGRISQIGTPEDLYERPANRFVAEFLGGINLLPLKSLQTAQDRSMACLSTGALVPCSQARSEAKADWLGVRPERVEVGKPSSGYFDARVKNCTYLGSSVTLDLAADDLQFAARVPTDGNGSIPGVGDTVAVSWSARNAWPLS